MNIAKMIAVVLLATAFSTLDFQATSGVEAPAVSLAAADQAASPQGPALATLVATEGNSASGSVSFTPAEGGVRVQAQLSGLTAGGHGFHIHQWGDCSSGDGKSAGGHFNPASVDHAGPLAESRHVGDLGNLGADAEGNASYDRVDSVIALSGANSIVGRAVIVHAGADDLASQPTGAAGARVACGVIGTAAPAAD